MQWFQGLFCELSICFQKLFGKQMAEQLVHERYPPFGDGWAGVNGFLDNLGLICCDESSGSKQGICLFFFSPKKVKIEPKKLPQSVDNRGGVGSKAMPK